MKNTPCIDVHVSAYVFIGKAKNAEFHVIEIILINKTKLLPVSMIVYAFNYKRKKEC